MHTFFRYFKSRIVFIPAVLTALAAGCGGGGQDPILGDPGAGMAPTVTVTSPASAPVVTGVATNASVTASFSEPMAAATITATSFTLQCPAGSPVAATVSYDPASMVATLTPSQVLPANTVCVATLGTAIADSAGFPLATNIVWSFVTAPNVDATRPTVTLTIPAPGETGVATNRAITATFSEPMNAATITGGSFSLVNTTLGGPAVSGTVTYSAAARTATFTVAAPGLLVAGNAFTATVSAAATDVAGNGLAGNTAVLPGAGDHVWSFTAGIGPDAIAPTVTAISPADGASAICRTRTVSATFSEAMNANTINALTFLVTNNGVSVPGTISYDTASRVANFVASDAAGFAANSSFVVTIESGAAGVTDLAGNALAIDRNWGFATSAVACSNNVNLRTAASFGAFGGGAGVTNSGLNTVVNGDLATTAACTLIVGFHDASNTYTETGAAGAVNGSIYCGPPAPGTTTTLAIATQARADAQTAYNQLAAMPPGSDPGAGQLGGLVLAPSVYTSAGGTFDITTGDLTLDAQGDANAVWVFQSASALTVGLSATPRRVLLINGAQARNVYWQVGSAARIEDGSVMVGTIIAPAGVTISTVGQTMQTTLTGRAIGLTASVTMVNTTIVAP